MSVLSERVVALLAEFVDGLDDAPAARVELPEGLATALGRPPPEQPTELPALLDTVRQAAQVAVETAGPRFFGYIPGGGLFASALAELLAQTLNRYTGLSEIAAGLVALEDGVLRWLCRLFGLPPGAGGLLTTGGSMATLSMLVAARQDRLGDGAGCGATVGTIYISDQTNHCVRKAARIAGFPATQLRALSTTAELRIDVEAAEATIAADRAAGMRPFLLVATAGTTSAGVIDPLADLAALARRHGMWYHVDACYGGFFQLTERGRARLAGIEQADSISLDPHKSLFLPYGTGALLVRKVSALVAAHTDDADYLHDLHGGALPDFAHLGAELTRGNRGLRLWLPLHLHGVHAFRAALDEKLDLAHWAHTELSADGRLEVPYPCELSTVLFRLRRGDDSDGDNGTFLRRINATGRVFLSSTRLRGRLTLRLCVLSHRTHAGHVHEAVSVIRQVAESIT
ncbi:MAG: aminotransferase class V-fold PLP-dependent enzyme [Pseudonocardiales bacterium]|nr:aminotransferase class V-fold PLP-dependent enzyme [Pseudonocardiales bacterium]MBV9031290.1 aminotransferase class V-fold PLP-dependent enzyme [Pseudonocardiales bacterium]MBW0008784.1 aminotransferase class V-fold PLP-dependent enzyme [Pseudonocardiales bacterium]